MHLHISRVRRNGKTYEYAQLVESFRRADGMPTQRIVARLGALSALEVENLRTTLRASRDGKRVLLDRARLPSTAVFTSPKQNLRYLDLAVLLELWRSCGVGALIEELMPRGKSDVAPRDVVAALALQRCVDPGSKLYAERWFPRTALPELLGVAPESFHNTRVHRVLDELDAVTPALMARLPQLYRDSENKPFAALFLDVSDARFVGSGPPLAESAKTKEGIVAQKVGIVLLCNEHGLPLRWHVIAGRKPDARAMHELLDELCRGVDWVGDAPVVCDRAMGTSSEVAKLLRRQLRFVTALKSTEFGCYTDVIPHSSLKDLEPSIATPDVSPDPCVVEAVRRVEAAGMKRVSDTMYVLDLKIVERDAIIERATTTDDPVMKAVATARELRVMVERGDAGSYASAGRKLGLSPEKTKRYTRLSLLERGLQQEILDGKMQGVSMSNLGRIAGLDATGQRSEIERLQLERGARRRPPSRSVAADANGDGEAPKPLRVRGVTFFNPERFVTERRQAALQLQQVQAYVTKLNDRLASPDSRRAPRAVELEMDRMLRRRSLLDVFDVKVTAREDNSSKCRSVTATLNVTRWQRRRRYDGFSLIVAHPDVDMPADKLCQLYRAKDAVEKDFQTIKSLIRLRPVWHRTDAKLRAHVTLCMLALMLERMLERKLRDTTVSAALELLATCCLNRFEDAAGSSHYLVTTPDGDQLQLLRQLRLANLAEGTDLVSRVRAQQPVAST